MKWTPVKTFNELLALLLLVGIIPGLWIVQGIKLLSLPEAVIGATIMAWGLVLQFFFRKKPPSGGP